MRFAEIDEGSRYACRLFYHLFDGLDRIGNLTGTGPSPLGHLNMGRNDKQQIVEIMRDAAGEMADGLHPLGLVPLILKQKLFFAKFHLLANVGRNTANGVDRTVGAAKWKLN